MPHETREKKSSEEVHVRAEPVFSQALDSPEPSGRDFKQRQTSFFPNELVIMCIVCPPPVALNDVLTGEQNIARVMLDKLCLLDCLTKLVWWKMCIRLYVYSVSLSWRHCIIWQQGKLLVSIHLWQKLLASVDFS